MFVGCKGFIGLSIIPIEIFLSKLLLEDLTLFDLKKGNPLRGESLTIRYVLDKAWKVIIQKAYPKKARLSSSSKGIKDRETGEIQTKILSVLFVLLISSVLRILPSLRAISSSVLSRSAKSSAKRPANGLLFMTMIRATSERIRKTQKPKTTLNTPTREDRTKEKSHGTRISILFLVPHFAKKEIIFQKIPVVSLYTLAFFFFFCNKGMAALPGCKLLARCLIAAALQFQVPPEALLAILEVEGGRPGLEVRNTNGTSDLGVMQINTIWLADISRRWKVPPCQVRQRLRDDTCFNFLGAAYILRTKIQESGGNLWNGIARYHHAHPKYGRPYRNKVFRIYRKQEQNRRKHRGALS